MRANLATITDDKELATAAAAFDLLLSKTKVGTTTTDHLLASATSADPERRAAMLPIIERYGLSGKVDWLAVYTLDLEGNVGCDSRKEAVSKLRALGDARAIPALEAAAVRKGKTGQYRGKFVNACLADEAIAAVAYLRSLAGLPAPSSGSGAAKPK